ncbi:hypothetical protein [Luteimonas terrae]|uniref:Uncharacterized protein n=1 Tax=Luteimonas terrae TaxID=1530191 RepID=A0ABU1XYS6_9GAMM|nr:hypothetical protein [Luteimonas terrae]MDR7193908.1 hypothetical protein [Luteimonas terrae]
MAGLIDRARVVAGIRVRARPLEGGCIMQDPTPSTSRPRRARSPKQVVNDLLTQLRLRDLADARTFEWTVDVRGMTDEALARTLALLAQQGYAAEYTPNDIPGFAHFILRW